MRIAIFTDLDGSLLDHDTYDFKPAVPAITKIKRNHIPLILASSKTGPELSRWRERLQLDRWPAIVENGGGVLPGCVLSDGEIPDGRELQGSELLNGEMHSDVPLAYAALRKAIESIELGQYFRGFGDMSAAEVAKVTGLDLDNATLAKQRAFTEPGVFDGTDDQKCTFLKELCTYGIAAHDGGRFLTLSFGLTKADRLKEIAKTMRATVTIALGDAPNDREMLLAADYPVIVRNDHAPTIGDIPGAYVTEQTGPAGWNCAVLTLLEQLECV